MPNHRINITQDEDKPVDKDILATAICKLSDAINQILLSGLNEEAIIVLLRDQTGISKRDIKLVLHSLGQLRADYTHA